MRSPQAEAVPDIIAKDLDILFCGINPGLTSAATQYHFARPGNRFWKALFLAKLTPTQFQPSQQRELLRQKIGITNLVSRPSASAKEISSIELTSGSKTLLRKVEEYRPKNLVILGIDAYKKSFGKKDVVLGLQQEQINITNIWVLPNPSGLNAHYSLEDFCRLFTTVKQHVTQQSQLL